MKPFRLTAPQHRDKIHSLHSTEILYRLPQSSNGLLIVGKSVGKNSCPTTVIDIPLRSTASVLECHRR